MSDSLMSPLAVAQVLKVSPRTVARWADDPDHPLVVAAYTEGGQRRFDAEVVEAVRLTLTAEATA